MLEWQFPYAFLLLPVPLLIYRYSKPNSKPKASLEVPFIETIEEINQASTGPSPTAKTRELLILSVIWILLLCSAARPTWFGEAVTTPYSSRDLMLAVDISGSMSEMDMAINGHAVTRINAVKKILSDFIEQRENDRLGLILFADTAYLQAPFTYDRLAVKQLLNEAQLGFAGRKTAIGDAIGLGIRQMIDTIAEDRVLILLTDGANSAGNVSPIDAATLASEHGITVHTIAIGGNQKQTRSVMDMMLNNMSGTVDHQTMQSIAKLTGGKSFLANDAKELETIYSTLDQIETTEYDDRKFRPMKALFHYPLAVAFLLCSLLIFFVYEPRLNLQRHSNN